MCLDVVIVWNKPNESPQWNLQLKPEHLSLEHEHPQTEAEIDND